MRRLALTVVALALAYVGLAGDLKAANDRFYIAGFTNPAQPPNTVAALKLNVTNDVKNGPTHPIKEIVITVPAGFVLTPFAGGTAVVTAPFHWTVLSVVGQVITITTTGAYQLNAGSTVTIVVNVKTPAGAAGCAPTSYPWSVSASQSVDGGTGNDFKLRAGSTPPTASIAPTSCVTPTTLALAIAPNAIITTDTGAHVVLTATLTGIGPVMLEPITFSVGAEVATCLEGAVVKTNASGVATCTITPQAPPNTPLTAGSYGVTADFAGDPAPTPDLGPSSGGPITLFVNGSGTGISVAPATGPYNGTANLQATLTAGALPLSGKTITFTLHGNPAGSAVTNSSGVATVIGASLAGFTAGEHDQDIGADFAAGDPVYAAASGLGDLFVTQLSSTISLSGLTQTYTGSSLYPSVTTNPAGLSYSWVNAPQTNAGSYTVTATITDPNYTGSATGTFVIGPATLTATITASDKVYSGTTAAVITGCMPVGMALVDVGSVTCSAGGGVFSSSTVGTWTVTAGSVTLGGSAAGNYQILVMPTGSATIGPKPASVTPSTATKVYGASDPAFTGALSGFLVADGVTATYSRVAGETVAGGPYAISAALSSSSGGLGNYSITYNTADFTITKATPAIKFTAFSAAAGSSSTGAVTFSTDSSASICTVSPGGAVTITGPGACNVIATQAADPNYISTSRGTAVIAQ